MFNKSALVASTIAILTLASCAHQSKVPPSQGHIDGAGGSQNSDLATGKADIPKPVKNNVYLPPPKARAKEQTYSVVVNEVPVKEILFALARESKLNVDIHPSIQGRVTMNAVDQTLSAILERISNQIDLTYSIDNNVLSVKPDSPFVRTYQINYVNIDRVTKGGISVSNQIAGGTLGNTATSGAGSTGSSTASGSSASGGGAALNNSTTTVTSVSENKFWDTLINNVKELLIETDKEVLIKRYSSDEALRSTYASNANTNAYGTGSASTLSPANSNTNSGAQIVNQGMTGASGSGNETLNAELLAQSDKVKESSNKEYRTLYAASVIPNKELGLLSVRATSKQHEKVQEFLDKIQASAKRQVLIEASVVEVILNDQYQAGVDWSRLGNGFTFRQELLGTSLTTAPRFVLGYSTQSALGDLDASVRLLQAFGSTKVLSSPKLMVLNSQTAILKSVDNLVYFNVQSTPATIGVNGSVLSPARFTTTPQTVPVGVWMSVTPQINDKDIVTLNVRPTISRKIGDARDPNPDLQNVVNQIPIITVREMESVLQVQSGSTVVLGGLMEDNISNNSNVVPEISKIPLLGNIFKFKNNVATKKELVIFLKPTVIINPTLESAELETYKQYLPKEQLKKMLPGADY